MKQSEIEKLQEKIFNQVTDSFAKPVQTWQRQRPGKRNAFLLFSDKETGRWTVRMFGNPRSKYHTADSLNGLLPAMMQFPELLDAMRAYVRCAERELKKAAKAQKKEENDHGKSDV